MSSKPQSLHKNLQIKQSQGLYLKSLRTLLESNCQQYAWCNPALGMIRARDMLGLLNWADARVSQLYDTSDEYFAGNQLAALIRKYPFSSKEVPGLNPERTAIEKFLSAEHRCKWINRRIRATRKRRSPYNEILHIARGWIAKVLGDVPPLDAIYQQCDFGAGASIGVHGNATNIVRKLLADSWSCTPTALPHALRAMWANAQIVELIAEKRDGFYCIDPEYFSERVRSRVDLVNHNKISFVPKTARTDRSIAVEPLLNGFLQKGVDKVMRNLLRKRGGIDLRYQEPNQLMALEGSRGGFDPYATIDLSAASDSISLELVRELLPLDWFVFLNQLRSPSYEMDGRTTKYEKFTSMGNGFCFPLETIIFAALARGVYGVNHQQADLRVYGDDIIVRRNIALHLIEVLKWCGFRTNTDKTFVFGPFRESCGADWYEGQDVRPVYLDAPLDDVRQVMSFHNASLRSERTEMFFSELRPILRKEVPPLLRFMRIERRTSFVGYKVLQKDLVLRSVEQLVAREASDTCFIVPQDVFLTCDHVRWVIDEQRWDWKEILSVPVADNFLEDHPLRNELEYLAVLRGASSSQPLSLRRMTKARIRWNRTEPRVKYVRPVVPAALPA